MPCFFSVDNNIRFAMDPVENLTPEDIRSFIEDVQSGQFQSQILEDVQSGQFQSQILEDVQSVRFLSLIHI